MAMRRFVPSLFKLQKQSLFCRYKIDMATCQWETSRIVFREQACLRVLVLRKRNKSELLEGNGSLNTSEFVPRIWQHTTSYDNMKSGDITLHHVKSYDIRWLRVLQIHDIRALMDRGWTLDVRQSLFTLYSQRPYQLGNICFIHVHFCLKEC